MRRVSLTLLAFITLAISAAAQIVNPVKWSVEVKSDDATSGSIVWTAAIESGYHIYGMDKLPDGPVPTTITVEPVDGLTLEGSIEPSRSPLKINDKMFALVLTEWEGNVSFTQKYRLDPAVRGVTVHSNIHFMACSDKACTPPKTESFSVVIGNQEAAAAMDTASNTKEVEKAVAEETESVTASQDQNWWAPVEMDASSFANTKEVTSMWSLLIMGFLGGLLALLTPCVWPMIPMTLSFFLKKTKSRKRSIADAITYGLSIVVIFLILGIAITLIFGAGKLNEIATSALFNLIFFALLVLFAISFFGAFDIKLPSKWSNAVDSKAESTSGIISIFFMAFTLVLVSFSCTGPIIGTLLVQAASEGSIVGPAIGMGGFALGLAIPFTLFAFFPSLLKEMPKSGGWMNSVKVVLGFIELILSLKFLSVADLAYGWRILDREVFVSIWIVLFILLGIYLLGKLRFSHDSESKHTSVGGFFLAVISFSFAVYLVPGLWGAPLKSISAFAPPLSTQDFNLYGGEFKEFDNYDEGMAYAKENNLPVIVDFSGYACVNCRKMEGAVFDTDKVRSIIESDYVLIKLMVDEKANLDKPYTVEENGSTTQINTVGDKWSYLQRHKFGINSQPYYVLLDNDGNPLAPARVYDEDVDAFVDWLNKAVDSYKASTTK
jgi:thiol:disulfide interchange protein DsbD